MYNLCPAGKTEDWLLKREEFLLFSGFDSSIILEAQMPQLRIKALLLLINYFLSWKSPQRANEKKDKKRWSYGLIDFIIEGFDLDRKSVV